MIAMILVTPTAICAPASSALLATSLKIFSVETH